MTARHQIRVGGRLQRGRAPIDATPAPTVGETLQDAREKKGVDLPRAERDTKIRAKHLAALENGDYEELPGQVYTRGFLRNYAVYLGLDPEEIVAKWHDEQEPDPRTASESIVLPPQPLVEPKGHLRFTRKVFAVAALVVIVAAFIGYLLIQVARFQQLPAVTLDGSPVRELAADAQTATLTGTSAAAATITLSQAGQTVKAVLAATDGTWSLQVAVTKGRNDFTITATDRDTGRQSAPVSLILTVPVPATPSPIATTGPPPTSSAGVPIPAAQLVLAAPVNGDELTSSAVTVSGTTDAAAVTVTAAYVGATGGPLPTALPAGASPAPAPAGPPVPAPLHLAVSAGAFAGSMTLPQGRWTISVATVATDALGVSTQSATVDVSPNGMVLTVRVRNSSAWIEVIADGVVVEKGRVFHGGDNATYTAQRSFQVHTGNAGATDIVWNGQDLGALGPSGFVQTWEFDKGKPPRHL